MFWWIPIAIAGGRLLAEAFKSTGTSGAPVNALPEQGCFVPPLVPLLGRTGAGKSSLLNMVAGRSVAPVGDVASTTRLIHGVESQIGRRTLSFVDCPGIGEIGTDKAYHEALLAWFSRHRSTIGAAILVLPADSKAYSEEHAFVRSLEHVRSWPLIIVLSQADKLKPVRDAFETDEWGTEHDRRSQKSFHLHEKLREVTRQFKGLRVTWIIPVAVEPRAFNQRGLGWALERTVRKV